MPEITYGRTVIANFWDYLIYDGNSECLLVRICRSVIATTWATYSCDATSFCRSTERLKAFPTQKGQKESRARASYPMYAEANELQEVPGQRNRLKVQENTIIRYMYCDMTLRKWFDKSSKCRDIDCLRRLYAWFLWQTYQTDTD